MSQHAPAENQRTVVGWADLTFPEPCTDFRLAVRCQEEMIEALRAISANKRPSDVLEEMADAMIVLYRLADRFGINADHAAYNPQLQPRGRMTPRVMLSKCSVALGSIIAALADEDNPTQVPSSMKLLPPLIYTLFMTAKVLNGSLPKAIEHKMAKNRKRVWQSDGSGCSYHVMDRSVPEPESVASC